MSKSIGITPKEIKRKKPDNNENKRSKETKGNKCNKLQTKVILQEDTINFKTKGIKKEDVFRKNSPYYKDDELIICMVLREKLIPYKCCISECSVIYDWNNKPLYLIINRKNKKHTDLRIENLEFQCPNCYMQNNGLIKWQKQVKERVIICKHCKFNISNFPDYNKINKICKICDQKLISHKKSNYTSYSALEECWDNSGELDADNLNKDYSLSTKQYEQMMNKDELEQILGPSTNQPYRFNISTSNQNYGRNVNNDYDNNENHRLSNIESSIASSFENDNLDMDNNNIDIRQLIKDVEDIAQTSEN